MKKLVLAVIDAVKPSELDAAIALGEAPTLARLMRDGHCVRECVSTFPSLTPVASATITTGKLLDQHGIPSMSWFDREELRHVEYGVSLQASRRLGVVSVLKDLVYGLNEDHLSRDTPTFFEVLEAAGLRTACTTYMVYRGPHRHEFVGTGVGGVLATATGFNREAYGPSELIYGDSYDSVGSDCRSRFGTPGLRDQHTACAGIELVKRGDVDFMLLSFPDNDSFSHRYGPDRQRESISHADEQLGRVIRAGGGYREFMEDHAVIVVSDHSQSAVGESIDLSELLFNWRVVEPRNARRKQKPADAELAVAPAARFGQVYVLDEDRRADSSVVVARDLHHDRRIDLVIRRQNGEAVVTHGHGELRFAPGTSSTDLAGQTWDVEGAQEVLDLSVQDGQIQYGDYPDALARLWSALECDRTGDVLFTAAPGYEFVDVGGGHHVGGGSHGSLHEVDSHGLLIIAGTGSEACATKQNWDLTDVFQTVLDHFGVVQ